MSILSQITDRLAALEARLADRPGDVREVQQIRRLLAADEARWIGTVAAQRLLGVKSINTVKAWARLGLLRSRQTASGRLQVHLDDVLEQRQVRQDLNAMGSVDRPLNEADRQALRRPPTPEVDAVVAPVLATLGTRQPADDQSGDR
ncbi:MAG: hypothetical protein IT340_22275 [Chloroflexi bacterium]|nr:hypothetical protein [Chloroflexota bacterium]